MEELKWTTSLIWWQETRDKGKLGWLEIKLQKCLSLYPSACTDMRRQNREWFQSTSEQKRALPNPVLPWQHQQHPPAIPSQAVGGVWGMPMPPMPCSFLVKLPAYRHLPTSIVQVSRWSLASLAAVPQTPEVWRTWREMVFALIAVSSLPWCLAKYTLSSSFVSQLLTRGL